MLPAFVFEPQKDIKKILNAHIENGANVLVAPTYLYKTKSEKEKVLDDTIKLASDKVFVAGAVYCDNTKTVFSGGNLSFDEFYNKIKEEVGFISKTQNVSMLFLMGFDTLPEAKYAVYAAKEVCDLPICITLDFKGDNQLSDGYDIATSTITLQSLGISALGVMADDADIVLDVILDMKEFASVPLYAIPAANTFITPHEFSEYAPDYINNKCVMFAGGKGTNEQFTAQIAKNLWQAEPFMPDFPTVNAICGKNNIFFMDFENKAIGTHKELIEIDLKNIRNEKEIDEIILKIQSAGLPPVCFNTKELGILERAIKLYPGRAAIKSDEYGEISAKEYGAIILCQGGN